MIVSSCVRSSKVYDIYQSAYPNALIHVTDANDVIICDSNHVYMIVTTASGDKYSFTKIK